MKRTELQEALEDVHRLPDVQKLSSDDPVRIDEQPNLVSRYYDLVTSFYEFGWGATFHFSPRQPRESLRVSQRRHDVGIAKRLLLRPRFAVADIGSGIGGPLLTIAQNSGAQITGINFNAKQNSIGEERARRAGLSNLCKFLYADFTNVPLEDSTFDAAYSFEAICHAPNKDLAFREFHRLLKPGAEAVFVDWALTDSFDVTDENHKEVIYQLETSNATPDLPTFSDYVDSVRSVGFEIIEAKDQQAEEGNPSTPWYMALQGRDLSLSSMARTPLGRRLTVGTTLLLERLKLIPSGSSETARILNLAADSLVRAGELGIFTPSFLVHARKRNEP